MEEEGGINLYEFVANHPTLAVDVLGCLENPTIEFVPQSTTGDMGSMTKGNYWLAIEFDLKKDTAMMSKVTQTTQLATNRSVLAYNCSP